ncbi:thiopeptide-type bacteriocin biosynthesis protein [Sphingobacterium thalpophilum]|uniref:Thiopeptide-type bacteriocin biosynthesis protein n=1 Tax=Sphingobacterium thalpophilum TaxID=259 RepID=A0ABV4HFL4_9SPHI
MRNNFQRTFIPGSEWFYVKIYCSSNSANKILTNELSRALQFLKRENKFQKWFFVRYSDPYFHLRLRILLSQPQDFSVVSDQIYKKLNPLIKQGIIYKIQFDTYSREVERYTEKLMELSESLFHIDSVYTMKLLELGIKNSFHEDSNWKCSLRMIDDLLSVFGYNNNLKLELSKFLDVSFKSEFGFDKANPKQLNDLYRKYKPEIEQLFIDVSYHNSLVFKKTLNARKLAMQPIAKKIMEEISKGDKIPIDSYIHMMMNRLFPSRNRAYELIVYSFLYSFYNGVVARDKSNSNKL